MAYSPLGISLPDLVVRGFTAPTASWGGTLTVTVNVRNQGVDSLGDPLAQARGALSTADAPPTQVEVFASPNNTSNRREILIGTIQVPEVLQNSLEQLQETLTLPARPPRFPGDGGTIYVHFEINASHAILETDSTNNVSPNSPVKIEAPFPQLEAVGIDEPPVMQPGDTIQPNIEIENVGPADTLPQGPVTVALVASTTGKFGPGSDVVAFYQIPNISSLSQVPSQSPPTLGDVTLNVPKNIYVIHGSPVALPIRPRVYQLGVVVDPFNQIRQLGKIGHAYSPNMVFTLVHKVGPPIKHLPPAGVIVPGGGANNLPFPFPVSTRPSSTTTVGGTTTTVGGGTTTVGG